MPRLPRRLPGARPSGRGGASGARGRRPRQSDEPGVSLPQGCGSARDPLPSRPAHEAAPPDGTEGLRPVGGRDLGRGHLGDGPGIRPDPPGIRGRVRGHVPGDRPSLHRVHLPLSQRLRVAQFLRARPQLLPPAQHLLGPDHGASPHCGHLRPGRPHAGLHAGLRQQCLRHRCCRRSVRRHDQEGHGGGQGGDRGRTPVARPRQGPRPATSSSGPAPSVPWYLPCST